MAKKPKTMQDLRESANLLNMSCVEKMKEFVRKQKPPSEKIDGQPAIMYAIMWGEGNDAALDLVKYIVARNPYALQERFEGFNGKECTFFQYASLLENHGMDKFMLDNYPQTIIATENSALIWGTSPDPKTAQLLVDNNANFMAPLLSAIASPLRNSMHSTQIFLSAPQQQTPQALAGFLRTTLKEARDCVNSHSTRPVHLGDELLDNAMTYLKKAHFLIQHIIDTLEYTIAEHCIWDIAAIIFSSQNDQVDRKAAAILMAMINNEILPSDAKMHVYLQAPLEIILPKHNKLCIYNEYFAENLPQQIKELNMANINLYLIPEQKLIEALLDITRVPDRSIAIMISHYAAENEISTPYLRKMISARMVAKDEKCPINSNNLPSNTEDTPLSTPIEAPLVGDISGEDWFCGEEF